MTDHHPTTDRCPRCGSDDPAKRRTYTNAESGVCMTCPDPWHDSPTTDDDDDAAWIERYHVIDGNRCDCCGMPYPCRYVKVAARIRELEAGIAQAVTELNAEHRPMWVNPEGAGYTEAKLVDKDPVGCTVCFPHDSDWPCVTRMITDDLRGLIR